MIPNNRDDDFDNAFELLLVNEGTFSNNPNDPGKGTIYGITERDYPESFTKIYNLYKSGMTTLALRQAKMFYKKHFWNELYKEIPDSSLALKLFDIGVNRSVKVAVKILQRVLYYDFGKTLKKDGLFGQITLGAVKSVSSELLYKKYIDQTERNYRSLRGFVYFGRGWLNRLFRRHII